MISRSLLGLAATAALVGSLATAPADAHSSTTPAPEHRVAAAAHHRAATPAKTSSKTLSAAAYTTQLVKAMNNVRRNHNLKLLHSTTCLRGIADKWATHLARTGAFEHQSLTPVLRRCKLRGAGEILAKGNVSPARMMVAWMHSSEHRKILLTPSFRMAGVSARLDKQGNWLGCIDFGHN